VTLQNLEDLGVFRLPKLAHMINEYLAVAQPLRMRGLLLSLHHVQRVFTVCVWEGCVYTYTFVGTHRLKLFLMRLNL